MKSLSKISLAASLTLAALVSLSTAALAQTPPATTDKAPKHAAPPPGAEGARPNRDAWIAELGLTDDQKTKVQAAQKEQQEKMRAFRDDQSLTAEQRREKGQELRTSMNAKLKEILTPDQFAKYTKIREEQRARRPGGPGGPGGAGGNAGAPGDKPKDAPAK